MPTIAHISDLHLQSGKPKRQSQVEPILRKINKMKPDLVVISGDVTDDGWESIEELKWAKAWLDERIDGEWFAVPGNHDVGNFVSLPKGSVTEARVTDWERTFMWNVDGWLNGETERKPYRWCILGFNSMLFGSGVKQEALERDWLTKQQSLIDSVPKQINAYVAVFIHSPLFIERSDEPTNSDADYWLGPSAARLAFYERLNEMGVKLIGSGHVHQTRVQQIAETKLAWAPPASGTWVHAPGLPNPPMPEQTGFLLHTLHDDGRVESELIECAPMLKLYEHNPWP